MAAKISNWLGTRSQRSHLSAALIRLYLTSVVRPREIDYSALLAWRKGKVKTSQKEYVCIHFPFPSGKQGRAVCHLRPRSSKAPHYHARWRVFRAAVAMQTYSEMAAETNGLPPPSPTLQRFPGAQLHRAPGPTI